jgi:hypothetical protein
MLVGFSTLLTAQNNETIAVLNKVKDYYTNTKAYHLSMHYTMYRGLVGNEIIERYTGNLVKQDKTFQMKIANNEILTIGGKQMAVDHDQKIVILRGTGVNDVDALMDIQALLEHYDVEKLEKANEQITCALIPKKEQLSGPYAKIVLAINPKTYRVTSQEIYYASQLPFKQKDGSYENDFARLKIDLKEEALIETTLSFGQFLKTDAKGEHQLVEALKAYELIDQTH